MVKVEVQQVGDSLYREVYPDFSFEFDVRK
jgi:hypothetical protein